MEIEKIKLQYLIIKDKLLLFSATTGGSFLTLINSNHSIIAELILYIITGLSFIGVLINLHKAGKIYQKLKD